MTRFRDGQQVCKNMGYSLKLTITEYSLTTSAQLDYKIQNERTLHLELRMRGDTAATRRHDTNDNVTTKTQSTVHMKRDMNLNK